ncbi:unnamed protein product [Protopolystoma xenopodis]|uniref:Uncharacterized protein n=1 Tax=Protopolystoma xenopodis TaxID=117903 RepID=A0A3S5CN48_9PLAT|nr:unnamed protein product [Protopolystoma xenopodis]
MLLMPGERMTPTIQQLRDSGAKDWASEIMHPGLESRHEQGEASTRHADNWEPENTAHLDALLTINGIRWD